MTAQTPVAPSSPAPRDLGHPGALSPAERYLWVRARTAAIASPLAVEDYVVQSMPDVSPTKWHLAHTSWFFETFVLEPAVDGYEPFHPRFRVLFNSYYNAVGPMWERPVRGLLSRPTVQEVYAYRDHVDRHLREFLESGPADRRREMAPVVEIGLNHEQQHQELMLTDLKHVLSVNPLRPVYRDMDLAPEGRVRPVEWLDFDEAVREIGHPGGGFAYDNEGPRHRELVPAFRLADRLVTAGEYLAFMEDGGYRRPELWLSDGWVTVQREGWTAPLYWETVDGRPHQFTLSGLRPVRLSEPMVHLSHYEADAFARWSDARLPTEGEWETAAAEAPLQGNFVESDRLHPVPLGDREREVGAGASEPADPRGTAGGRTAAQLFGDVWEWTSSPYTAYPGYRAPEGALGEYNGKFMINQMVLRGGSCATPVSHIRRTYRNFFPPTAGGSSRGSGWPGMPRAMAQMIPGPVGRLRVDDGGTGEPEVLLVHGLGGSLDDWSGQIPHLRRVSRTVALDLRAHGESDADPGNRYAVEDFAGDVAAVIDQLGLQKFVLVAHSFAGHVAGVVAERHAHRLKGLFLADPSGDSRDIPDDQAQAFLHGLGPGTYEKTLAGYFEGLLEQAAPRTRERVLAEVRRLPRETAYAVFAELLEHDPVTPLERYPGPKLALTTEVNDGPASLPGKLGDRLPRVRMDGVSHWPMMDDPERFNRILDEFLAGIAC